MAIINRLFECEGNVFKLFDIVEVEIETSKGNIIVCGKIFEFGHDKIRVDASQQYNANVTTIDISQIINIKAKGV